MAVIPFPSAASDKSTKKSKLKAEAQRGIHDKLHLGSWSFECTKCDSKIVFETETLIFRKLEFYCSSCGSLHTVSNPAFVVPSGSKNK